MELNEKYIYDNKGNKESVVLPYNHYLKILEIIEDNEDIQDYLQFLKKEEELVNFDEAMKELDL